MPWGLPVDSPVYARSGAITLASIISFVFALSLISVVHQAARNAWPTAPLWAAPGLALVASLAADDVVFRIGAFGPAAYLESFPGGLPGKLGCGLLILPMVAVYLSRLEAGRSAKTDRRPTLDLLFGSYGQFEQSLQFLEARKQSLEIRLETVISHAPIVLFGIDESGVVTLSEGAGLDVLGLRPGQIVGESVYALFPEVEPLIRRALEGEAFSATVDMEEASFDVTYVPVRSAGKVTGLIGVGVDVTETRRAERALEESDVRFRSTFTHAGVGLLHSDLDERIMMANQAFLELLGYSKEEMVGQTMSDITHEDDVTKSQEEMANVIAGKSEQLHMDKRYVRKDGVIVWCQTTATLVRSPEGEPLYFVVAVEDLTERLATEAQLRQAQKMEAVGQLTGGIAHDFNNMLTVIMGGLELAMDDEEHSPEAIGSLREALRSAEKGAELTRQLLAFSRRQALRPVALDVSQLLAHMQSMLVRTLGETIEVVVSVDLGVDKCIADRAQTESAILNLALNARDAMPRGGRLSLTAGRFEADEELAARDKVEPGSYVEIRIQDSGPGMTPEELDHAFEPFFTTKEVGKGSGLGLSMVYGFAKQSGGGVHLSSEPDAGLTVRLLLPSDGEAAKEVSDDGAKGQSAPGGGERILLVEDDPGVRRLMVTVIRRLGYEVLEAAQAEPALKLLEEHDEVDLLLTDVVLGGKMNGPELARIAIERYPGLPIIFTSGYSQQALPDFAELSEPIPLLAKPFRQDELASLIRETLG